MMLNMRVFWGIACIVLAIRTPRFLNEFMVPVGGGGVINNVYHSVRLEAALCKGCINCIKRCPTQAIRVRDGKAQINGKFCIDCGECIRICPHHAKIATYDKLEVMRQYEYTVALPAPSLYSQFNNLEDVNIVLKRIKAYGV